MPPFRQAPDEQTFNWISTGWGKGLLALAAMAYLSIHLVYLDRYPVFYCDEVDHSAPAINWLEHGRLDAVVLAPIAGFEKSNPIRGRIYTFIQAVSVKLFGASVFTLRLQSLLAGLCTIFLVYLIGTELFKAPAVGLLSAMILATSHLFTIASHMARADMMVGLFATAALYFLIIAEKRNSRCLAFLAGLISSLAIDLHPPGNIAVYAVFALACYYTFRRSLSISQAALVAAGIGAGIVWWYGWHVWPDPQTFRDQMQYISGGPLTQSRIIDNPFLKIKLEFWRWYSFFWQGAYHRNMFPLSLLILSGLTAFIATDRRGYKVLGVALAGGLAGFIISAPNKTAWYIIYLYPLMCVFMAAGFYTAYSAGNRAVRGFTLVLGCGLAAFVALESSQTLRFARSDYAGYISKIQAHLPQGSVALSNDAYWLGLRNHVRHVSSHWLIQRQNFLAAGLNEPFFAGTFEEFMARQGVEYVVADPEFTLAPHHQDTLNRFLKEHCEPVAVMEDDFYGLSDYLFKRSPKPLTTTIYKVKPHAL